MPALNLLTFLLTWSGRQLETYTQGNITIEFEYDENGLRHRKTVKQNGVITERYDYVWSEGTLISQTYTTYSNGALDSTNSAKFIYDAWGTLQGFVLNDTATYLYTKNLQGDILSIVNESGQTIVTYEYDSWGAVSFSATSMQNLMLAYTLSFVSPFTYRGYCYDYDIELYYLQSRYYSAEIGRFINTDDTQIAIATQGEILGANLFAYCNNNPVVNVDHTGTIANNIIGLVIGAVIGVVGGYFLAKWLAGKITFDYNWQRNAFIGTLTALVTASAAAIGYFVGPYIAKAWNGFRLKISGLIKSSFKSIGKISTNSMNKIRAPKHLWDKVLGKNTTNANIQNLIYKAIRLGETRVQTDGIFRCVWVYKNQRIVVTYTIVNNVLKIGDSWVWNGITKLWGSAV